ncbi:hypothetical protein [Nonomuraea sp. GTA35]|uniref:hypothetical protein n=1 Tax=Nonomuraea sp. GTA35 TaxID=1676746 RepID=UPI0035C183AB
MTHVDDLYEANDREPDEDERWAPGVVPVNLGEVEQRLTRLAFLTEPATGGGNTIPGAKDFDDLRELIGYDVPGLIADLAAARERIAGFEALEKREEWTVTGGPNFPAKPSGPPISPDKGVIAYVGSHAAAQLWRRMLSLHPWEPIDSEPPF